MQVMPLLVGWGLPVCQKDSQSHSASKLRHSVFMYLERAQLPENLNGSTCPDLPAGSGQVGIPHC